MEIKNFFFSEKWIPTSLNKNRLLTNPIYKIHISLIKILNFPSGFLSVFSVWIIFASMGCHNLPLATERGEHRSFPNNSKAPETTGTYKPEPGDEEIQPETPIPPTQAVPISPSTTRTLPSTPRIGVIVGPGFMRSFISIGILQEFHKARVPIQGLIGFEWGSLPAALYSLNGQSSESEWKMLKLKESMILKKSLLRKQLENQSIGELADYLNENFNRKSFDQTRLPFECLTFDYKKKQYFWMKKGDLAKGLGYCLASPPFFKPHQNNVSAVELRLAAENLRQKGVNYIILINNMGLTEFPENEGFSIEGQILWATQQYQLSKSAGIVDFVVDTNEASFSFLDFDSRRDMIRKGQEIGIKAIKKLSSKLGI